MRGGREEGRKKREGNEGKEGRHGWLVDEGQKRGRKKIG